ncbi:MAG: acyl-CoA/acyl-ACP dehydrogenase [Alphaproteobacteria bacterium]|nr:acyl-CoA/acyl-ACP dehydrogenase [Alphaproteobacteria bacterium]
MALEAGALSVTSPLGGTMDTLGPDCVAETLRRRIESATAVAATHAEAVDREARFPGEAIDALRHARLLGVAVPRELGGEGVELAAILDVCYRLGQACASTAMIFAMHQIKVACIARHARGNAWHEELLRRLCGEQLLLASSTTEGQSGGNVRASAAAIERSADRIALERSATVISYGAQADGIVTTARRSADAAPSDQVLVVFLKQDYRLEPLLTWDTLGMRGTCSAGFSLRAAGRPDQILPEPYDGIHQQTMVPVAHLTWSSVWAGVAAAAVARAQLLLRHAARQANGQLPPGAAHFTRGQASLRTLLALIAGALRHYEAAKREEGALASLEFQTMINTAKVEASELAVATVMSALRACGLSGYRNDGEFSVARHLRDVLSSPLMISNDRILSNIASAALMSPLPDSPSAP